MQSMTLAIAGNLTGDPELRFTQSGKAVVSFNVAHNARRWDSAKGEMVDAGASFLECRAWGQLAENIAESLHKGDRVVASGKLAQDHWETDKGEKRSTWRLTVDAAGPDLTWATASVRKSTRRNETAPDDEFATASRTRPEPASADAF